MRAYAPRTEGAARFAQSKEQSAQADRGRALNYKLAAIQQDNYGEERFYRSLGKYKQQRAAKKAAAKSDDGAIWGGAAGMALGVLLAIPTGGMSLAAAGAMASSGAAMGSAGAAIGGMFDDKPTGRNIPAAYGSVGGIADELNPNPYFAQQQKAPPQGTAPPRDMTMGGTQQNQTPYAPGNPGGGSGGGSGRSGLGVPWINPI